MNSNDFYFFKDQNLEKEAQKVFNENKQDVIKINYNEEIVWLKRPRSSNSNLLHKTAYFMTRIKGLMPVETKDKKQSLYHEVSKIQRLKEKGINVPEVLGCNEDFFLLENTGTTIKEYLKDSNINTIEVENILEKCVNLLSKIHNSNEYHAGPQVKNYTIKENTLFAIDFEDSFSKNIKLEDIQYRDFFLFLVSLAELNKEINYKEIIQIYMKNTQNTTIDKELKKIALNMNFLAKIVEIEYLNKKFSKDVIYNYNLIKSLQQL